MRRFAYILLLATTLLAGCREEDIIYIPEEVEVSKPEYTSVSAFYLLNEGNMNSNKATIDLYNYKTGKYILDLFPKANPHEVMQMGDVGNDLQIYGTKLYCVLNASNKIDVMDKMNLKKIGQVNIPNCRYIQFHGDYAYVTSYVGPIAMQGEKDNACSRQFLQK